MSALYQVYLFLPDDEVGLPYGAPCDHKAALARSDTLQRGYAGSRTRVVEVSEKPVKKGVDDGKVEQRKT
jgi:hypothetical protein